MEIAGVLFVFALIISLLALYIGWRRRLMSTFERNGIKGPKPHLIYGNLRELHKDGNVVCIGKWMKQYGPIFGYYAGASRNLIIADPSLLKQIQIKDFKHFTDRYKFIKRGVTGDPRSQAMLISAEGQRWKELRTILRQAFTVTKLKNSIKCMDDPVNTLLENIDKFGAGGKEFDIYPLFQGLTMETIGRSAFGITTEAQKNQNDPFLLAAKAIFEFSSKNSILLALSLMFPELEFILYPLRWIEHKILGAFNKSPSEYLMKMSSHIVEQRRKNKICRNDLLQAMIDARVNLEGLDKIKDDSLTIGSDTEANEQQVENGATSDSKRSFKYMTDDEIVGNTTLFFEAGYETTSTALAFVAHILVNHEDIQDKIREEVIQLYEKEGKLDYNTVSHLPFMEAVIYETLRIYPPITFFVSRHAKKDYEIEGLKIPKHTGIIVPVYQLHHDEKFWNEPEKFDPYRFYGENKSNANSLVWQPFGAGPRNCIGMRFALLEMKLALSKLLLKYHLKSGPNTEGDSLSVRYKSIVMCPNHVYVRAIPIEGK